MTTIVKDEIVFKEDNISGSKAVILSLLNEGSNTIFGYPGGAIMPIYDALYDYDKEIKHILTRHEQGAVHAAEAYAKVSGKTGVVFATSGPGATNLITGLANAMVDSTPIICITGQVHSHLLGFDAFQETDVVGISMPVTKWNYQITKAEEIPEVFAKAFYLARTGRPGPILIDITKDAQIENFNYTYQKVNKIPTYYPYPKIKKEAILEAAELINSSKKPLILAGQGIKNSGAEDELKILINKTGIPVATTLLGMTSFSSKHPLYFGMLGMHGNYAPNIKTNEADLIIAIGMRFDDRVTSDTKKYAKNAKVIHIDIDPSEIDKNIKTDVSIIGDAKKVIKNLIPIVNENEHKEWIEEFNKLKEYEYEKVIKIDIFPDTKRFRPAEIIHAVSEYCPKDTIVVTDVGQHQMMAARYFNYSHLNELITSGGLGTMGFGLPAAFGASVAAPNRQVVLFVGDGGFQMTIQELDTIRRSNSNIKIIMLNNSYLGMVRQWQELFNDRRYSFTTMDNPNFIKIVEAYTIKRKRITKREELKEAIKEMFATEGPYFLEAVVEKEDNVFPMVPSGASVSDIILSINDLKN
ncbi:MAG: biosynthetic-type acetolactate synthase large subunit [Chlorobi bacterium]|nr:biosynthetic-type acetolactate synthase large subunit [Chlorobiota bacterium]